MHRRSIPAITTLIFVFIILNSAVLPVNAQRGDTLSRRVDNIQQEVKSLGESVESLNRERKKDFDTYNSINEYNKFLISLISGLVAVLVSFQVYSGIKQQGIDNKRDNNSAEKVSNIMHVVHQTLESRLNAEEDERKKRKQSEEQLEKVLTQIRDLEKFYQNFQVKIQRMRKSLEKTASQFALFSRHDFKNKILLLNEFSRDFDQFKADSEPLEEGTHSFDARVPYIRGIAAHYNNQPELAKQFLTEVTAYQQPEQGEDAISFKRRVANAYYYLGLTETNFGNDDDAIAYFENANHLDPQRRDFLTKVVYAEAYVMNGNFEKAVSYLNEVESTLQEMDIKQGGLASYHLRLRSRAALIRANMEIMRNDGKWGDSVKSLLEPVHMADPKYYYATATLAQAYAAINDYKTASKLFREVHETIIASSDLMNVNETRSRILLLMFAGMSARHGLPESERMANDYLDEADGLRGSLPKIGEKTCTVFSPLSKRNEDSEKIYYHINLIRKGSIFLA